MSFQQGLSGLRASATALDVTSNNIANAQTVGFKSAQTNFADVYATSVGCGGTQIGVGVSVVKTPQQFSQGTVTSTSNPLDLAVNGKGFFVLGNNGATSYTRNGQFQLNKDGYVVTSSGFNLRGYQVDASNTVTGAIGDLWLNTADIDPKTTTVASGILNLDSRSVVPVGAAFPAALTEVLPATVPPTYVQPTADMYNSSTSTQIYDSLGNPHVATFFFSKVTGVAGTWDVHATIDGGSYNAGAVLTFDQLVFDTSGNLTSPVGPPIGLGTGQLIGWTDPSVNVAQTLALNFNGTTQFGSAFGVNSLTQDGYGAGRLTGFNIGVDGLMEGIYTNKQTRALGQVALANFANPQGLKALGDNQWTECTDSGNALIGAPGSSSLGVLRSSAVEESNVDLTVELVNMIVEQRNYQANAQTIKTQDQILQTLVNLR
jgi:flagellar hook protein FlgE